MSCAGPRTGRNACASRVRIGPPGEGTSSYAIRSATLQGLSDASRNAGRDSPATAAWKARPAAMTSTTRSSAAAPGSQVQASQPSCTHPPVADATGRAVQNELVCSILLSTSDFQRASSRASWGRRTMLPARQARPRPPSSRVAGLPATPKAASVAGVGEDVIVMSPRYGARLPLAGCGGAPKDGRRTRCSCPRQTGDSRPPSRVRRSP